MEKALKQEIKRLCLRAQRRVKGREAKARQDRQKFEKRTGLPGGSPKAPPTLAGVHKHFDPAHCARNANIIARTIWKKVLDGTYVPTPAVKYQIPKPQGGVREIMAFAIPDAALANVVLWRARERNIKRLSPFSYAYHPDRDVFDAILALKGFMTDQRLFAVQIDFQKYFDTIPTRYMRRLVDDRELVAVAIGQSNAVRLFGISPSTREIEGARLLSDWRRKNVLAQVAGKMKVARAEATALEQRIFEGFPDDEDERVMREFASTAWPRRASLVQNLNDPRLQQIAQRLIFLMAPESLAEPNRLRVEQGIRDRLLDPHG
ncbi:MAG: hypothetical protein VW546_10750, partial [Gammaproteobacteria bacterium]